MEKNRSMDFWPVVDASPVLPPDHDREARLERRRAVLAKQGGLLSSLLSAPPARPGEPYLMYKSGGVWRRIVV